MRGVRHPVWAVNAINQKLMLTPTAKVSGGGERLVIKDWQSAVKSHDFVTLAHIHRYSWVQPCLKGCVCLDAGCGAGYGTYQLALTSQINKIVGVDISIQAIKYNQKKFKAANLEFKQMNVTALEFASDSFDAVISFDVLEHLNEADQEKFITEVTRVLKPNGKAYIGCPNGKKTALSSSIPFHLRELLPEEFELLLKRHFQNVNMLGQDILYRGVRQKESRDSKVPSLSISNFVIVKDDYKFGLLSVCKQPVKHVIN